MYYIALYKDYLVLFSPRKKVRLKVRERRGKETRVNKRAKRGGRPFQSDGPIESKDLVWTMVVL